jgi:hypothetical protein
MRWQLGGLVALGAAAMVAQPAAAGTLINGWNYSVDPGFDGIDNGVAGLGGDYEIYGLGIKQQGNHIFVGINSNLDLDGKVIGSGRNAKQVGWGDLLFDFSPSSKFDTGKFEYGVRFAPNDNNVNSSKNGVYQNVTTAAIASVNYGFASFNAVKNTVDNLPGNPVPGMGDLVWNDAYFGNRTKQVGNVIGQGTEVSDVVTLLSQNQLAALGFGTIPAFGTIGSNVFGFKFEIPKGFEGDFLATLLFECINDGITLKGTARPVPVPGLMAGMAVAGAYGLWRQKRRKTAAV